MTKYTELLKLVSNNKTQTIVRGGVSFLNLSTFFLFQILIIKTLGASLESDAYIASTSIPMLILAVVSGSLLNALIPFFSVMCVTERANNSYPLIILLFFLFLSVSIILYFTKEVWVPILVPGFDLTGMVLTSKLTGIQLINLPFGIISAVLIAAHYANNKFVKVEFYQFIANFFCMILVIIIVPENGAISAAWISVFRFVLQDALMLIDMNRPEKLVFKNQEIFSIYKRVKPLLLGAAYYRTEPVIDRYLLSTAPSGLITLYYLAGQVFSGFSQLINKTIVIPKLPLLGILAYNKKYDDFILLYNKVVVFVCGVSVPIAIVVISFAALLLDVLIEIMGGVSGDWDDLWWIMFLLVGSFIGAAGGQIAASGFYAIEDTLTPTRMSFITYSIFIPIKFYSYQSFGFQGLAITVSTYSLTNFFLLLFLMNRRIKKLRD